MRDFWSPRLSQFDRIEGEDRLLDQIQCNTGDIAGLSICMNQRALQVFDRLTENLSPTGCQENLTSGGSLMMKGTTNSSGIDPPVSWLLPRNHDVIRACIAATMIVCGTTGPWAYAQESAPGEAPETTSLVDGRADSQTTAEVARVEIGFDELEIPASKVFKAQFPNAVGGEYLVVFKQDEEVVRDVRPSDLARLPTRGLLPNNRAAVTQVANDLAKQHRGVVRTLHDGLFRGFSIAAAEADVAALAKDPRVKFVQPVLIYRTAAEAPFRQLPSSEEFWHLGRCRQ